MKNLLVWQKLTLLGAVFLLPLIAVTYAMISSVNTLGMQTARQEILGVEYAMPLLDLLRDLQQRRGLAAAMGAGGNALRNTFETKSADVEADLKVLAGVDARLRARLGLGGEWRAIEDRCRVLLLVKPGGFSRELDEHTAVIRKVVEHLGEIADRSSLTLDTELGTCYLQDLLTGRLPQHAEMLGRAWARAAAAPPEEELSPEVRTDLQRFTAMLDYLDELSREALAKAWDADESIARRIKLPVPALTAAEDPLNLAATTGLVKHSPIPFYHAMAVRLVADYDLAAQVGTTLSALLHERVATLRARIRTSLLWSVCGLLAVSATGWWIMRDITVPLGQLRVTARAIGGGNPDAPVDVPPRDDEIGELAEAFRTMLAVEKAHRAKLVEGNAALTSANAMLHAKTLESQRLAGDADSANRAKRDFLAVMSHEIRTPMNGIIGMTDLALGTHLTAPQREYLDMVKSSAESLLLLLNDILDFSKIEAGRLELDLAPFDLRDALGDTMQTLAIRANDKGLELALHIAPEVPDALLGDSFRLRQILVNLVGNAIKFTDRGEVTVHVQATEVADTAATLRFAVEDTGIGIEPAARQKIFTAFSQADTSTTRRFGGSGLGLAITSQLVALMGGRIEIEGAPGEGSTFSFAIRFTTEPERRQPEPAMLESIRVLAVDDNATNRMILRELFASWRMEVLTADSAAAALLALDAAQSEGRPVALLVTDMMMPDIDGLGLVQRMRDIPSLRDTRVIMLTSANSPGDAARCAALGITAHLAKPIKQSTLMAAILDTLGAAPSQRPQRVSPAPAAIPSQRPLRILLAEDNKVNQRLALVNLEAWGHRVTLAGDGAETVERAAQQPFDLILMDAQMPRMSGFEATAAIRARERGTGHRVPIVAMTANVMRGYREECLAAGMDGYVPKPLRREELIAVMAQAVPDLLIGGTSPASAVSGDTTPCSTFDPTRLLANLDGQREIFCEMARLCLEEDAPKQLALLHDGLARGDLPVIEHAAHALKGVLGEFNAPAAWRAAKQVEDSAHAARTAALPGEAEIFLREFARFTAELRQFMGAGS